MVHQYLRHLEAVLSSDRLRSYAPRPDSDLETITNYFWNIALCQALYPSLGTVEVVVRNSLHATLTDHFGQSDWYDIPGLLQKREREAVVGGVPE